jgi:aminoglycoside/choline kinase family phosphotransferase
LTSFAFNQVQIENYRKEELSKVDGRSDQTRKTRTNALPPPSPAEVGAALKVSALTIEWLAGDGSDRCYYRVHSPELSASYVLMQLSGQDAKALAENGYDWIKIADLLTEQKISVPRVIASMPQHAALIIEDYGDQMLENIVFGLAAEQNTSLVMSHYQSCFNILAHFLNVPQDKNATWCSRAFDRERFEWELNFFADKYLKAALSIEFKGAQAEQYKKEVASLSSFLAGYSNYFVHRDFHSRNVMVQNGKLAVIDFQDARLGPPSYDLVSLCFDSYVPFNATLRSSLMDAGLKRFSELVPKSTIAEVRETWKPMLVQRQLKAIGSFGFLTIDKKRGDYLKYVAPAVGTLTGANVSDDRWPLITTDIPKMIEAALVKEHG